MIINPITFLIGLIFSPIAAMMAFFVIYGKYQHHYSDNAIPRKLAIEAAAGTFVFFMIISVVIGWFLGKMLK